MGDASSDVLFRKWPLGAGEVESGKRFRSYFYGDCLAHIRIIAGMENTRVRRKNSSNRFTKGHAGDFTIRRAAKYSTNLEVNDSRE